MQSANPNLQSICNLQFEICNVQFTLMSILKVARMGHPVLRAKARALEKGDIRSAAIQRLIDDMIDTMIEYHGVGLAAPQVHEPVRLFVAALDAPDDGGKEPEPVVIINPEIVPVGSDTVEDWEGCLSIPEIRGRVPRAREIRVRAFDRKGDRVELRAHDFPARVIQHETDHLDGVLFLDRMRSFETLAFLDEYSRYWTKD
jgi:peptide deformylase